MPVYVDKAQHKLGRMVMCHMLADSMDELLTMADTIGVNRKWFQPQSHPHFDICKAYRAKAIAAGAIEVDRRQLVDVMKRYRTKWSGDLDERKKLNCAAAAAGKKEL
ncbi:DUF4031 domain-containing protein [Pseudooceanicola sp. MF1-13]|uniref:DUF4031 domain-containing protein n=1 Tax=Pseudooceanicola sp. MF1-13 TaxID=3379095 RepID=UPI003891E37D